MRKLFLAAPLAIAAISTQGPANELPTDDAPATIDVRDDEKAQYNIWFCAAIRRGYQGYNAQFHFGASQPFGAGSGQGQFARDRAYRTALGSCGGSAYCVADCYVQRFQM